jgi:hypothetical protein
MPLPNSGYTIRLQRELREGLAGCIGWIVLPFIVGGILIGLGRILAYLP